MSKTQKSLNTVRWTLTETERKGPPKLAVLEEAYARMENLIIEGKEKTPEYEQVIKEYKKAVLEDAIVYKKDIDRLMDSINGWGYSDAEKKRYQESKFHPIEPR